jgi:hypothetical protein
VAKMRSGNFGYFVKRTRLPANANVLKGVAFYIRSSIVSVIIFIMFVFSLNLIIKYMVNKISFKVPEIPFNFNESRFIIANNKNFYLVNNNADIKLIEKNIDGLTLPVISGISVDEKSKEKLNLLRKILKINKNYFSDISDINIQNINNIIMYSLDGKKIIFGDDINKERMENYSLVKSRLNDMGIKYKTIIFINDEKIIVKKEGK